MFGKLFSVWGMIFCVALCQPIGASADRSVPGIGSIEQWLSESVSFQKQSAHRGRFSDDEKRASSVPVSAGSSIRSAIIGGTRTAALRADTRPEPARATKAPPNTWKSGEEGILPGVPGDWLFKSSSLLDATHGDDDDRVSESGGTNGRPSFVVRSQLPVLLAPAKTLKSVGAFPAGPEGRYTNLEIEVSHSRHTFKLTGRSAFGKKRVLYHCRIGLGSGSFPTPKGAYFVTHIYDDNPWWIPPQNRAWAWGQSPSRTVYGGTMAPLLKKRSVRSRSKKTADSEDRVSGKVKLEDYGYRFHGTNAPHSIGRNQSHGCVRMLPKDARAVARLIIGHVGTDARRESENGEFAVLKGMVRLSIVN
jgi:L,D-transpeptidase catalytic domain